MKLDSDSGGRISFLCYIGDSSVSGPVGDSWICEMSSLLSSALELVVLTLALALGCSWSTGGDAVDRSADIRKGGLLCSAAPPRHNERCDDQYASMSPNSGLHSPSPESLVGSAAALSSSASMIVSSLNFETGMRESRMTSMMNGRRPVQSLRASAASRARSSSSFANEGGGEGDHVGLCKCNKWFADVSSSCVCPCAWCWW